MLLLAHTLALRGWGNRACYDSAQRAAAIFAELGDPLLQYVALTMSIKHGATFDLGPDLNASVAECERIEEPAWPAVLRGNLRWAKAHLCLRQDRLEDALVAFLEQAALSAETTPSANWSLGSSGAIAAMALGQVERAEGWAREGLACLERLHAPKLLFGMVLTNLVRALVLRGQHDEAIVEARRALPVIRVAMAPQSLLEFLGLNAALHGRLVDAAIAVGHADAVLAREEEVRYPVFARLRQRTEDALVAGLDAAERARLDVKGRSTSLDAAFAHAFGDA